MKTFRAHWLICSGTGCQSAGSLDVREALDAEIVKRGLAEEVKVVETGCNGYCAAGPVMVAYPEGIFYQLLTPEDAPELVEEHLVKGRPVTRLLYREPEKKELIPEMLDIPFFAHQKLVVLRNKGMIDPEVIDESVQITKAALKFYPDFRKTNAVEDIIRSKELAEKTEEMWEEAVVLIEDMEKNIRNLCTSEGLYTVFKRGYFPVPYLWEGKEEFSNAVDWTTKIIDGGIFVVDEQGKRMSVRERLERIKNLQA